MKKIMQNIFILLLLVLIIIKRPEIINSIILGMDLWKYKIFPSIFPILIVSDLILSSNLITLISKSLGKIFYYLFNVSPYGAYVFIMSSFSGCPANAKYLKDLLDNHLINSKEAIKILSMTLLYNPILIITITSYLKLGDSLFLIISNIIINLIIGLINRNRNKSTTLSFPIIDFKFSLVESISKAINTLLLILGSIITFITLSSLIPIKHPLISGILEITNGINLINMGNFKYSYQLLFTGILLSFGGISIITQIKSILKDANLDYSLFYQSRIIHLIIFMIVIIIKILGT